MAWASDPDGLREETSPELLQLLDSIGMRVLAEPLRKLFGVTNADDVPFVQDEQLSSMGMGVVQIRRIWKSTGLVVDPGSRMLVQHAAPLAAAEKNQPWMSQPGHLPAHLYDSISPDDVNDEGCVPPDAAGTAVREDELPR